MGNREGVWEGGKSEGRGRKDEKKRRNGEARRGRKKKRELRMEGECMEE